MIADTYETYNVLLVDDDEDDFIVTRDCLSEAEQCSFRLTWLNNAQDGLVEINRDRHDVYLLDYRLGKDNGLDLMQAAIQSGCSKPIILLTGVGDQDIDRQAMLSGAADYLVKGNTLTATLLERSILHAIERKQIELQQLKLLAELAMVNQELKDFAYIVSHDLKAPLRGIASLASWLQQDYHNRLDPEGQKMLDLLGNRVRRMGDLIDGVLRYSRVGRLVEERQRVDPNQVVMEVIDAIAPPPDIQITLETELPSLWIGKNHLYQIFQNLISNAVKYMGNPQGLITIGHSIEVNTYQFYVKDTGIGIAERHFEKIFQIFQTLGEAAQEDSTGVGLSIVKKILTQYGGRIWVTSELTHGSTFWFTLPITTSGCEENAA